MSVNLPLAYGYIRLDLAGRELTTCEQRMQASARERGYQLAAVFREREPLAATLPQAFIDLIDECRRAEAHMVFTVCGHLTGMATPRTCLLDVMAARGLAHVCELPA
ncbi:hypothetical protein OH799_17340 [Nocardia sp. NBC_00881]|uniref:hypothetical protein n=1 Tax=Nocardia sp. NBC_00881 TaxID=2975995 RepID=UPI00386FD8FA|nr:hypothetical protein OH799_17340 [Nocardia sp. NBC_00881]